jgi:serine phosphatase RsbU (regulator of sigma subunit)
VLIADVSGHGETVAGVADDLRDLMRRHVNYVDQTRLVGALNEEFGALASAGAFATAVVATYLAPERRLTLSSAGHPTPLWHRARTGTWSMLRPASRADADGPANIPLGVAGPTRYDQSTVTLGAGDLVVLYTDALIEARDADGRPLGEEGLLRTVADLDPADPADFMKALLARVDPDARLGDDATILVMRRNSLVPRASAARMAVSELRLAGRIAAGLLARRRDIPWPDAGPIARILGALRRIDPRRRA